MTNGEIMNFILSLRICFNDICSNNLVRLEDFVFIDYIKIKVHSDN